MKVKVIIHANQNLAQIIVQLTERGFTPTNQPPHTRWDRKTIIHGSTDSGTMDRLKNIHGVHEVVLDESETF